MHIEIDDPARPDVTALLAEHRGEMTAEVISAQPLTVSQTEELRDTLSAQLRRKIQLQTSVDASLLGGIVESRWSNADELLDGIEQVGIRAIAISAGSDAGIEGVSAHMFRRTVATVINEQASLNLASELLGHTDPKVTIEHYIRRNEQVNPLTAELLDQAFAREDSAGTP